MAENLKNHWLIRSPLARTAAGIGLLVLAVIILWLNESAMDIAKVARSSLPLPADKVENSANRQLVSITGQLTTGDRIGDPQFLQPDLFIKLFRKVEVYQKKWTDKPTDASAFQGIRNKEYLAPTARLGAYTVDPQMLELPRPSALKLTKDRVILGRNERLEGNYIYIGDGTLKKPRPGDLRVSFAVVANSLEVTAFGKKQNDMLAPFITIEYRFYRAFKGTRDEAIAKLPAEHKGRLWTLRFAGCLMTWLGFYLFSFPAKMLIGFIPGLNVLNKNLVVLIAALAFSLAIIIISIFNPNLYLLAAILIIVYLAYRYSGKMIQLLSAAWQRLRRQ